MALDSIDTGGFDKNGRPSPQGIEPPPGPAGFLQPVLAVEAPHHEERAHHDRARMRGIALSVALHIAALTPFLNYAVDQGATDTPTEAISIELAPTEVLEAIETAEAENAAAQSAAAAAASSAEEEVVEEQPEPTPPAEKAPDHPTEQAVPDQTPPTEDAPEETLTEQTEVQPPAQQETEATPATPEAGETQAEKIDDNGLETPADAPVKPEPPAPAPPDKPADAAPQTPPPPKAVAKSPREVRPEVKPDRRKVREAQQAQRRAKRQADAQSSAARGSSGSHASARQSASRGSASSYAAMVRARVAANKPGGVAARGRVQVSFGVSSSGGVTFARANGSPALASAATSAVRRAAPFPPPPAGAPRSFSIVFTFQ